MPTLEEILRLQRNRLLKREAALVAEMEHLFNQAIRDLEHDAMRQAALVQHRIDQGENPLSAQLTLARTNIFIEALGDVVADVAMEALTHVLAERRAMQIASAQDFIDAANASDVHAGIDPGAVSRIGLALASDTPVRRLFESLPELAAQAAREALFTGVATGANPRQTARAMARGAGIARNRASTIARTETLRAYRNAQLDRMAKMKEIERWVWVSARDRRTCAFCWAQHGRVFTTDRRMATHPNCRCSQGPLPKGANTTAIVGNGKALFDKLPAAQQLAILGPAKFRAFKAGAIELRDLVGSANHKDWGPIGYERSLKAVLGADVAKKYYNAGLQIVPPPPKPPRVRRAPAPPPPPPRNPRPTQAELVNWDQNAGWKTVQAHHARVTAGKSTYTNVPNAAPNALNGWGGRGAAKDHIATELGGRLDARARSNPELAGQLKTMTTSGDGYAAANMLVGKWAGTSADSDPGALAVQRRAAEKYQLPIPGHTQRQFNSQARDIDAVIARHGAVIDNFLEVQYDYTQEVLRGAGVKELTLYRGQGLDLGFDGPAAYSYAGSVTLQPLSSFSVDPATSTFFTAGGENRTFVAMRVPTEQIFSTPITGYGCFNEGEFVVLGGKDLPAHVIVGRKGYASGIFQSDSRETSSAQRQEGADSTYWNFRMDDFKTLIPEE